MTGTEYASPALYSLLGIAFLQSDAGKLREILNEAASELDPADPLGGTIHSLLLAVPRNPEDLGREFVRLFLDPAGAPCPPWQSAHDAPPRLMGESHLRALRWYRGEGVQPCAETEPADHSGYLLMFYAHLLESGKDPDLLARFRSEHLDWIVPWLQSVQAQTRLEFYRELAAFGLLLLQYPTNSDQS